MAGERIEFSLAPLFQRNGIEYPLPCPAGKIIPEWFKSMSLEAGTQRNKDQKSVKNCPPFLEAIICGYIIPLCTEIKLTLDAAGLFQGTSQDVVMLSYHEPVQVKGAPFEKLPIVKIYNPWIIRTPPGYSTLFQPLLNRFEMPLIPLAGLVETDNFYRNVNFPCILTIQRGANITLAKGTPLVQAIPIKREEFHSEIVPADTEKFNAMNLHTMGDPEDANFYKNNFWRKKTYR